MSYTFEYFSETSNENNTITILTQEELSLLDNYEKIEYQASPTIKEINGNEIYDLNTLGVQGFIYNLMNAFDPKIMTIFLNDFMQKNYKSKWDEMDKIESTMDGKVDLIWNFIDSDDEGDEATDKIDLYILNEFYKNEDLYSMLIEECEKRSIKVVNQDINVAAKIFYKIEEQIEEFKNEKAVSHATFTIIIWVANVLKDSNKNCILHDPEDNLFKRNVLPLLELESMKTLISQILNMAEIMGELNEYLHIGEGHAGNYPSIEEFKNDLDLEYIKKFMREVCEDLKIKQ